MTRRPARCTEADLKRVIRAVMSAGTHVVVEIPVTGPIRVIAEAVKPIIIAPPKRRIAL